MIGFNHALMGGVIAKTVPLPYVAPLALASHFVLDALPHYRISQQKRDKSKFWKVLFTLDTIATVVLAVVALVIFKDIRLKMFLGGLFATIPDYIWVASVVKTRSFDLSLHDDWFSRWHKKIQIFERPWGIWVELTTLMVLTYTVFVLL